MFVFPSFFVPHFYKILYFIIYTTPITGSNLLVKQQTLYTCYNELNNKILLHLNSYHPSADQINSMAAALSAHDHDNRYYTETEIDQKIANNLGALIQDVEGLKRDIDRIDEDINTLDDNIKSELNKIYELIDNYHQ